MVSLLAALQQRGQFRLAQAGRAIQFLAGLFRLVVLPVWLVGTLVLLFGSPPSRVRSRTSRASST
jgi:hypothetical protein